MSIHIIPPQMKKKHCWDSNNEIQKEGENLNEKKTLRLSDALFLIYRHQERSD